MQTFAKRQSDCAVNHLQGRSTVADCGLSPPCTEVAGGSDKFSSLPHTDSWLDRGFLR